LIGGFMMSRIQSGSADAWVAIAGRQHRDTVRMT